jgi:hypothetical protein
MWGEIVDFLHKYGWFLIVGTWLFAKFFIYYKRQQDISDVTDEKTLYLNRLMNLGDKIFFTTVLIVVGLIYLFT